jgi:hypothetical protein
MEFGKEHAEMPTISDCLLEERDLVLEIFLLAEEASHAAAFVLNWANRGAFCPHPSNTEAAFLEGLLQPFWFTVFKSHLLGKLTKTWRTTMPTVVCMFASGKVM